MSEPSNRIFGGQGQTTILRQMTLVLPETRITKESDMACSLKVRVP